MNKRKNSHKSGNAKKVDLWFYALLAMLAFALYANTLGHEYALDDYPTIYGNRLTMSGVESIPELARTAYWYGMDGQNDWLYRPLSMIMFAAEWQLSEGSPALGHWINVLLYMLTSLLLFRLLMSIFKDYHPLIPVVIALLWVAHPIHTEVVANIKSRDEILAFLFSILTIQSAYNYVQSSSAKHLLLTFVWFLLAMFSKESPITLIFIVPMTLFVFSKAKWKEIGIATVPVLIAAGIYLYVRAQVLTTQIGDPDIPLIDNSLMAADDYWHRQAMAFYVLGMYVKLLIFPVTMSCDYSYKQIPLIDFTEPFAIVSLIIMFAAGIYAVFRLVRKQPIAYGILFYLAGISLVSNVVFLTRSTAADRFLYFPGLGFSIFLGFALFKLFKMDARSRVEVASLGQMLSLNKGFTTLMLLILVAYSWRTIARNKDWKNDTTIFTADVENAPNSARIHFLHANHLLQDIKQGNTAADMVDQNFSEAVRHFNMAVDILPDYYAALTGLGEAYTYKGQLKNALEWYEEAIRTNPNLSSAYNNLGNVYFRMNRYDEGIRHLTKAVQLDPGYAQAYSNLGTCYFGKGEYDLARQNFEKAIALSPWYVDPYKNLGSVYGMQGDFSRSNEYFLKALEFNPKDRDVLNYLKLNYQQLGDQQKASEFEQRLNNLGTH